MATQFILGLLLARDGNFYGAAMDVIWRMTPKGAFTVVHTLDRLVEGHTVMGMTQASDGNHCAGLTSSKLLPGIAD